MDRGLIFSFFLFFGAQRNPMDRIPVPPPPAILFLAAASRLRRRRCAPLESNPLSPKRADRKNRISKGGKATMMRMLLRQQERKLILSPFLFFPGGRMRRQEEKNLTPSRAPALSRILSPPRSLPPPDAASHPFVLEGERCC